MPPRYPQAIGGRCVFTSEWDKKCNETYALNFPDNHAIEGDIREKTSKSLDIQSSPTPTGSRFPGFLER